MHDEDIRLEDYVQLPYPIRIIEDDVNGQPCYVAVHPELPGCTSIGDTPTEAVENLAEARADYIRVLRNRNLPIPLPQHEARSFTVRVEVRTPRQVMSGFLRPVRWAPLST